MLYGSESYWTLRWIMVSGYAAGYNYNALASVIPEAIDYTLNNNTCITYRVVSNIIST